jgi:hypothetical protein
MAGKAQFIQIAATSNSTGNNQVFTQIFALDSSGDVWVFDRTQDKWRLMPTMRQEG